MESNYLKRANRIYLRKVFRIKTIFYPVVLILIKTGIASRIEKSINRVIKFFGIRKNFHYFIKYIDYGNWFKDKFRQDDKKYEGEILFPAMTGVHSNFTLLNLLFARYFNERKNLLPVFYICDSAFDICTKDGMVKSRKKYFWFCHECYKGYRYIEKMTGIDVERMRDKLKEYKDELVYERRKIECLTSLRECEDYEYDGIKIGLLARKSVKRYFLAGRLEASDEVLQVYREFIFSGVAYGVAFKRTINERKNIRYVILNNGSLVFEAIAREYCKRNGIPYITYETYIGNNSLIYKKNGPVMDLDWSDEYKVFLKKFNMDDDCKQKVKQFFENLRNGVEMYAVLNREHSDEILAGTGRYACLFTNLNYDTAVIDKNYLFADMEDWIYRVIEYWKKYRPDLKLIIRVHPGEIKLVTATREYLGDKIKKAVGDDKNIIVVDSTDKVNSYELIKSMEYGLIYSSTIGLEIAWSGKTCIVAGLPWFRHKPFVIYPETVEDYFNYLEKLNNNTLDFSPDIEELYRTVYFVYYHRLKRLQGIKLYTPDEGPNTIYSNSDDMINNNLTFFEEFSNELFSAE